MQGCIGPTTLYVCEMRERPKESQGRGWEGKIETRVQQSADQYCETPFERGMHFLLFGSNWPANQFEQFWRARFVLFCELVYYMHASDVRCYFRVDVGKLYIFIKSLLLIIAKINFVCMYTHERQQKVQAESRSLIIFYNCPNFEGKKQKKGFMRAQ